MNKYTDNNTDATIEFGKIVSLIKRMYTRNLTHEQIGHLVSRLVEKESAQDSQAKARDLYLRLYLRAASNSPVFNSWLKETLPQMPWNKEVSHA